MFGSSAICHRLQAVLLAVLFIGAVLPERAEARRIPRSVLAFSGYVNFTSDYIFRGVSRTNGTNTVQADLGMNLNFYGQLRLGIWGSGLAGATAEIREYAYLDIPLPLVSLHVGATKYRYPGALSNRLITQVRGLQTDEVLVGASLSLGSLASIRATLYESRTESSEQYTYTEIFAQMPFGFSLIYGNDGSDSEEANLSLTYSVNFNRVTLGVTYHGTRREVRTSDIDNIWIGLRDGNFDEEDVVLSLSARF